MHKKGKGKGKGKAPDTITSPLQAFVPSSASKTKYSGPMWVPGARVQEDVEVATLTGNLGLTSSAGGVLNPVFDQTMTNLSGWTQFAALWDEFRILKYQVEYYPANRYNRGTTTVMPGAAVIDRDSNGALGSLSAAFAYSSARMMSLDDPWTNDKQYIGSHYAALTYSMDGAPDDVWLTCSAPTPTIKPSIKVFFSGLAATTFYGTALIRVLVQFRGRF
jgi:hypothetical protein